MTTPTTPTARPDTDNPTDGPGAVAAGATPGDTRELTYAEAVRETLTELMADDERVFLMGEDIGVYGGAFGVTTGLLERFGRERVRDTPISEIAIVGAGVGAALCGMRPIVELQFSDFVTCAMDQIVNQAAKIHFMLGGAAQVPLVIRAPAGSGTGAAAQHSQSLEAWFAHVPGIKVVMPATPADAMGLLRAAVEDPNPVLVLEHKLLYKQKGEVPAGHYVPLGKAEVRRRGSDLTIVATAVMVGKAMAAAEELAAEGIEVDRGRPAHDQPARRGHDPARGRGHRQGAAGPGGAAERGVRRRDRRADRRVRHLPHAQGPGRAARRAGRAHGVRPRAGEGVRPPDP